MAGPFDRWPLGRGFDRFYGFLGVKTDQYHPDLVYDNHYVEPPAKEGYHLTEDPTDQASAFLRDLRLAIRRSRSSCTSAPAHSMRRIRCHRNGSRGAGAGSTRGGTPIERKPTGAELELGLIPPGTELSPRHDRVRRGDDVRRRAAPPTCA